MSVQGLCEGKKKMRNLRQKYSAVSEKYLEVLNKFHLKQLVMHVAYMVTFSG